MEKTLFTCIHCDYATYNQSNFNTHLMSIRHRDNTEFKCHFCGSYYKHQCNLYRHQKRCYCSPKNFVKEINENIQHAVEEIQNSKDEINANIQNSKEEIQTSIQEINTNIENKINTVNTNIENKINNAKTDIENKINTINTNIKNQTNLNKHTRQTPFNLNFYLNETCKDALNLEDFIKNINPRYDDVVLVGKNGYVEGNAGVIIKYLLELEQHRRPIQCSDLKRQTVYLKSKNKWEKDADGLPKTSEAVDNACNKIYRGKKLWEQRHPEYVDDNHKKSEEHHHLLQTLSGAGQNVDVLNNKVANKVIKSCIVNKDVEV